MSDRLELTRVSGPRHQLKRAGERALLRVASSAVRRGLLPGRYRPLPLLGYRFSVPSVPGEDGGEGPRRVVLHAGQDVLVGHHGERGVGVPKPFGDDLDRHAVTQQQAGVGVAEIVLKPMSA